ncbi:MAG: SusD/RagB family nutrient-binding outer membrane lipoprotein [Candidatus Cryptobacteroides sp.]
MKKYISIISAAAVLLTGTTACESYLDINRNPNVPEEENISNDMIFPGAEMALAVSYGDCLRILGGYLSQYYSQYFGTSNYLGYSQFQVSASTTSGIYSQLYQKGLTNLATVQSKASASNEKGTFLAATVLRAFIYQTLVDCYSEVPYTEAINESIVAPKYDDGKTVYKGILAELDAALANVSDGDLVCNNFLFPGETASPWIEFANALKLRILMRMSNVEDVNDQLAALIAQNRFPSKDIELAGCWEKAAGKESPFYGEEFSTLGGSTQQNVIANIALIGTMQVTDDESNIVYTDPRLEKFFKTNQAGNFVGGISGTNFSNAEPPYNSAAQFCRPVASFDMPVSYISVAEVEFFLAEYAARYGSAADAEDHYKAAIKASFNSAGADGADAHIARYAYDNAKYAECIGVQKWIALSGVNPFEAFCELRRLDYPAFGTVKGSDMYNESGAVNASLYQAGKLYTPFMVFGQLGDNKLLERFPYAESSESRNPNSPVFPGYSVPVFWGDNK